MSIARFEQDARKRLLRARVLQALLASAAVSDDEVKAHYLARNEKASITYVKFSGFMFRDQAQVSDAEATAFAKDHANEIEAAYNRDKKTRWTQPMGVKVRAITASLPPGSNAEQEKAARARIDAAYAEVNGGKDFAAVAKEKGYESTTSDRGGKLAFASRGASASRQALKHQPPQLAPRPLTPARHRHTPIPFPQ